MSGKVRHRNTTNAADLVTLTVNERILRDCHQLYSDPENGLIKIASSVDVNLLAPRKKITILLIGNHSAGKSTFINWYIEEHILKTGVAIETQGFAFVTSGRKRESLTGNATLHLYPHFKPLAEIKGLVDYLTTEISTSKQKKFSLVTFIDTPGLVDGDMKYPFDVNKAILFLGGMADLIFVFFDPIGQALCKRTLNLVEALNNRHCEKIKMYLSKADEAGHEADRQKVLMQIVQELCKRPGLNKAGFDLPTIFIPNQNRPARCVNQIEELCKEVEKTINRTVQNTLNALEADCNHIDNVIESILKCDKFAKSQNWHSTSKGVALGIIGILLPLLLFINIIVNSASIEILTSILGSSTAESVLFYLAPVHTIWKIIPSDYHLIALLILAAVSGVLLLLAKWYSRLKPTLTRKQKRDLLEKREYVQDFVKTKKHHLYQEYLKQSVTEQDF